MASAEMQLVCKIIKTGDLRTVLDWGITEDDFMLLEPRAIFKQIVAIATHPDSYGSVIGPSLASEKFSQLNLEDVDTAVTLPHLCKEVRTRRLAKQIKEAAQKAMEEADTNPIAALDIMNLACADVRRLDAGKFTDVSFDVGMAKVWERYQLIKSGVSLGLVEFPWYPLQLETGGVQEDDFMVLYGRPKSMKTWVLAFLIAWCVQEPWIHYSVEQHPLTKHQRILVYTKEMTPVNIYQRVGACLANIPYSEMRRAQLSRKQEQMLEYWVNEAKRLAKDGRLIVLSAKDVAGRDTVAWLHAKIEKYAPTIVFVDGLYLMSPANAKIVKMNERVASISRDMRQLILDTKTPVIATMQANRKAAGHEDANLDEIAFSDAIAQDATMLIRVINDKNVATEPSTISLVFGGSREINFPGLRIFGQPAVNFGYCSMLNEKDIEKAKKADDPDDPPTVGKKGGKRDPQTQPRHKPDAGNSAVAKAQAGALKEALKQI